MSGLPLELARHERRKPAWELALLYPDQGRWTEDDYLDLDSNRLIEYTRGRLEFLPMPTKSHQLIVLFLVNALRAFTGARDAGQAVQSPFPVRIGPDRFREPDVAFLFRKHAHRDRERYWDGADLLMEVVSPSHPGTDRLKKRREYAQAGVPEYWIVDPPRGVITVLRLRKNGYVVHGEFGRGQVARSHLLAGFAVDVDGVMNAR